MAIPRAVVDIGTADGGGGPDADEVVGAGGVG